MAGVYVSYPFCDQKCTYCNFASGVPPAGLESEYIDAVAAEIAAHRWQWSPETVYLGGGTPSRIPVEQLARLLDAIPGRPWREATIEVAPGTVTPGKAQAWKRAGITRASLGVQSFVSRELARTGRKHTSKTVARDAEQLRAAGIDRINIDLIAGLPFQNEASWRESLDWVGRLEVGHVSVYMLEVDEDSRLGLEILNGGGRYGARDIPDDDRIASFYQQAVEYLHGIGLRRYEISNFARPGFESLHNLKYWRLEPYIGFGADAHSFDGKTRRRNVEGAGEYVDRIRRGLDSCAAETPAELSEERFFVGLRLEEGIRPASSELARFAEPIRRFLDDGLLAMEDGLLRLTNRGVLLSNEVFQEFLT